LGDAELELIKYDILTASNSSIARMQRTINLTSVSDMQQRHAAILFTGGRVVSVGINTSRNVPSEHIPYDAISNHAEINCLKGIDFRARQGTLYLARVSKGGNIALAAPCNKCLGYLEKRTTIRKVVHT